MTRATVLAARRSAIVPRGGAFAQLGFEALAAPVIAALLADAGVGPGEVGEMILSNALGAGGNPARRVALAAGMGHVAGLSIDRQCVGGLDAMLVGRALVESGAARLVVAGGVESFSQRPLRARAGAGGRPEFYDQAPFTPWPDRETSMAEAADALGRREGITRAAADAFAVASHARARAAAFGREIVPVAGVVRDAFTRNLTLPLAARARPALGAITPANAAVEADGAAFVLIGKGDQGVTILSGVTLGAEALDPGMALVPAANEALRLAGLSPRHLSVAEVMEAYAVQAMAGIRAVGLDPAIVNRSGGALARGHPIGASGAVLAVRLWHELTEGQTGLAAISGAGGIGTALILRRA